jgi:putative hydrolase of the HAD superfamily
MDLRAVVFDYGMVLSAPPDPAAHRRMIEISGLTAAHFEHVYWANREDYDSGSLSGVGFWGKFAKDAGIHFDAEQSAALEEADAHMWMVVDEPTLNWALQLKAAGLKTGILSNIGDSLVARMRREFAWLKEFDQATWSYELGIVKPEAGIYRYTLEKLGVEPHQALFLDDRPVNIRGAEAVGMRGIVFTSLKDLADELRAGGFEGVLPMPVIPLPQEA